MKKAGILFVIFSTCLLTAQAQNIQPFDTEGKDTITTESGLQYIIVKEGTGEIPLKKDKLTMHYTGYFTDGEMFESSHSGNRPFKFKFLKDRVIPGWEEALKLMKQGARYRLIIPWNLGYGEYGIGEEGESGYIPPKTDLIFDVELIKVEK